MTIRMRGYFESVEPFVEHGPIDYFDDFGNLVMECTYDHGEPTGFWIVKDYFQVAYAELDYNFNLVYQNDTLDHNLSNENDSIRALEPVSETLAAFPGGEMARKKYMRDNTIIPYKCFIKKLNGTVMVACVINKNGFIENPVVIESSGIIDYDKEAIRILRDMPRWQPGTQNNIPVDLQLTFSLEFQIDNK